MTTLSQSIRIHAPVERVYELAEDPALWAHWYVGISSEESLTGQEQKASGLSAGSLQVGVRFPLTQQVLEDCLDARGARWRCRSEGVELPCEEGKGRTLVMLDANQSWTYEPVDSDTEVTIVIEYQPPALAQKHPALEAKLERLESGSLRRSLERLRRLCEAGRLVDRCRYRAIQES